MPIVYLSDIENVSYHQLNESRLRYLENGYDSFDRILNSSSDPVTLSQRSRPYEILDGRHRVYLARKKGYSSINIQFS